MDKDLEELILLKPTINTYANERAEILEALNNSKTQLFNSSREEELSLLFGSAWKAGEISKLLNVTLEKENKRIVVNLLNLLNYLKNTLNSIYDGVYKKYKNQTLPNNKHRKMDVIWNGLEEDINQAIELIESSIGQIKTPTLNCELPLLEGNFAKIVIFEKEHYEQILVLLNEVSREVRIRLNQPNLSENLRGELRNIVMMIQKSKDERERLLSEYINVIISISKRSDDVRMFHTEQDVLVLNVQDSESDGYFRAIAKKHDKIMGEIKLIVSLLVSQRG